VPVSTSVAICAAVIADLKLEAWAPAAMREFKSPEMERLVIQPGDVLAKEAMRAGASRSGPRSAGGTLARGKSKLSAMPGAGHESSPDEPVVCVSDAIAPLLDAWHNLQQEWREAYARFCEQQAVSQGRELGGPPDQQAANRAPGTLGHFSQAMENVLPVEVWEAVSKQTNSAACYFRQVSQNLKRRETLGLGSSGLQGAAGAGAAGQADNHRHHHDAAAGPESNHTERAHFLCDMCALAWADVVPGLATVSRPRPGELLSEILVAEPGGVEQGGGMGRPFGLSVDTSEI